MNVGQQPNRLCVLLVCFAGAKRASHVRSELGKGLRSSGADLLDEAVLKVNGKGKAQVYDPRRTLAGTLTPALTWGLFGLLAGGWKGLVIWAVVGALCGGLWAYYTEHIASKSELTRIGAQLGPDTSALLIFAEAADAERLLSATAPLEPASASVAAIADDLSAKVFAGAESPVESSSTGTGASMPESTSVLNMLLLRYSGEHAARSVLKAAPKVDGDAPQVELVFESDKSGKRRVSSPTEGVAYMVKEDIIGWGVFGVAVGAITGFAGNGGILGSIESGVVTGVLWAIFGLFAGALYGLWAGRAVSARRLKGVGPLLPPDSSTILAWAADGAATERTLRALSTPDAETLGVRFNPVPHGAILEV